MSSISFTYKINTIRPARPCAVLMPFPCPSRSCVMFMLNRARAMLVPYAPKWRRNLTHIKYEDTCRAESAGLNLNMLCSRQLGRAGPVVWVTQAQLPSLTIS